MTDGKKPEMPNQYQEWLDKVPEDEHRTHWADCWTVHIQCAIARAARLQSDLIAAQKEANSFARLLNNEKHEKSDVLIRAEKAEQALALRGEPVAWRWQLKGSGKRWGFATDKDGERWQRFCELWAASTELRVTQDEDGTWSIFQVEAVENEGFRKLTGNTPDAAIDVAIAALPQKDGK